VHKKFKNVKTIENVHVRDLKNWEKIKILIFLKKIEPEFPNGRYFYADSFAVGTGCCANGQYVLTAIRSVPKIYWANGGRWHRVVPTAWQPTTP
jgi:hypothetical protein